LHDWLTDAAISKVMLFDQKIDPANLNSVLTQGYAPDLNDSEIEEIGQGPFLNWICIGRCCELYRRNEGSLRSQQAASQSKGSRCL
jgi:hypothetical protein